MTDANALEIIKQYLNYTITNISVIENSFFELFFEGGSCKPVEGFCEKITIEKDHLLLSIKYAPPKEISRVHDYLILKKDYEPTIKSTSIPVGVLFPALSSTTG